MNLIDFNKDVYSVSDVGLVRKANEDNCYAAETPNGFLFVVCDGMGGHVGGARASAIAVNSIVNFFTKEHYAAVGQALEDALNFANCQILNVATEHSELKGMGTTACMLLLCDAKVYFAHIGDSRIYLYCKKQQQLHRITKDHSVVQGLVDQGVISEAEAECHPNKNQILKTLGIKTDIQPDICQMPVLPAKGDIFLICSDGLSGMVNDELLQHILEQKVSLQEKGDNMLTFAKQAGGTDNITIQLIHISNSPHANSVFISKNSHYSNTTHNNKKNNNTKMLFIALIAVVLSCIVFLAVTILTKKDAQNVPPTTIINEMPQKKAWEKAVEGMTRQQDKPSRATDKYYKNGNKGVIVYSNDEYFVGEFDHNGAEIEGNIYKANGEFKRYYKN